MFGFWQEFKIVSKTRKLTFPLLNLYIQIIYQWSESCSVMSNSLQLHGLSWNSPGQSTGVGSLFPSPGDIPNLGIEPRSPALQADSLPAEPQGKPCMYTPIRLGNFVSILYMHIHKNITGKVIIDKLLGMNTEYILVWQIFFFFTILILCTSTICQRLHFLCGRNKSLTQHSSTDKLY